MKVFVCVAEQNSFVAAARLLKMSAPAVSRAIAALEGRLGVKLFLRTTRHVRTTDAGGRYLEDCRRILLEVEQADEAVVGVHSDPSGQLMVTAPVLFGQKYIMPGIVQYLEEYPNMRVTAALLDRVVNLMDEGFDIGVRIGNLPDSTLHAKKVGSVRQVLVASPEYLGKNGVPKSPHELQQHCLISSVGSSLTHDWNFLDQGKRQGVSISPKLVVNTNQAAIDAAVSGFGITRALSYQVIDEISAGTLAAILIPYELPPLPIHLLHREGIQASAKVRSFIDLMTKRLIGDAQLN
ncbi:LysR family transcriptional regulator [Sneathiella glossodoripedis]|uniref:LysR family transcriptional regulator n=1 Tax=Sneathiella glossodoripedis TaxID=418853 RepID=UPI000567A488|nr:LysR family transcriptional regulator [Sneathiella glossodoripedis]